MHFVAARPAASRSHRAAPWAGSPARSVAEHSRRPTWRVPRQPEGGRAAGRIATRRDSRRDASSLCTGARCPLQRRFCPTRHDHAAARSRRRAVHAPRRAGDGADGPLRRGAPRPWAGTSPARSRRTTLARTRSNSTAMSRPVATTRGAEAREPRPREIVPESFGEDQVDLATRAGVRRIRLRDLRHTFAAPELAFAGDRPLLVFDL